jgi:chemotaxis protein MotB
MYGSQQPYASGPSSHEYERMVSSLRRPAYGPWLLLVLVSGLAGYGAYWGWGERQRLMGEVDKGQEAVRAHKQLETKFKELEAEKTALATSKDTLEKDVAAKASELAELKGTHDKLQDKMKEEIAKGEIELTQSGLRLKVDMVDKILFDSGDAAISKRGEGVIARVGGVLANIADKQIHVSGHTDNQPITGKLLEKYPSNWELSMARAMTIVRFLQDTAKVPPDRLVATGQGEYHPIASNKTAKGRARNRRIEILLTPALEGRSLSKQALAAQTKPEAEEPPAAAATAEKKTDAKKEAAGAEKKEPAGAKKEVAEGEKKAGTKAR